MSAANTARALLARAASALPDDGTLTPAAEAAYAVLARPALFDAQWHLQHQEPELACVTLHSLRLLLAPAREDDRLALADVSRLVRADALALVALAELGDHSAAHEWRGLTRWAARIRPAAAAIPNTILEVRHVR